MCGRNKNKSSLELCQKPCFFSMKKCKLISILWGMNEKNSQIIFFYTNKLSQSGFFLRSCSFFLVFCGKTFPHHRNSILLQRNTNIAVQIYHRYKPNPCSSCFKIDHFSPIHEIVFKMYNNDIAFEVNNINLQVITLKTLQSYPWYYFVV